MSDTGKYADKASGTAKEKAGEALGNESLKTEGEFEKAKGKAKDTADKAKDKAEDLGDKAKDKAEDTRDDLKDKFR